MVDLSAISGLWVYVANRYQGVVLRKFSRLLVALSVSMIGAVAPGVVQAQPVSSADCRGMFSISATNLSGTAVEGSFTSVMIATAPGEGQRDYSVDNAITGVGSTTVCHLTTSQIDELTREDGPGTLDPNLKQGDSVVAIFTPANSTVVQVYRIALTDDQANRANANEVVALPNLVVSPTSQLSVVIKDSVGAVQGDAMWEVYQELHLSEGGESWTDYRFVATGYADGSGSIGVAGLDNGDYQLRGYPGANPTTNSMKAKASFAVDGGVASFTGTGVDAGVMTLPDGNTKFSFISSDGSELSAEVKNELNVYIDDESIDWDSVTRRADGSFVVSLPERGSEYTVWATPGAESGFVETKFTILAENGTVEAKKNDIVLESNVVPLDLANFRIKAVDLAGNPIPNAGFQIFNAAQCATEASITNAYSCDPDSRSISSSRNGISMVKIDSGTFWMYMDFYLPIYGSASSLSKIVFSGGTTSSQGMSGFASYEPGVGGELPTITLSARASNFDATVTDIDGNPISGGWINAQKVCTSMCTYGQFDNPYSSVDESGKTSLYLKPASGSTPVQYEIQIGPSLRSNTVATGNYVVSVNSAGVVTAVEPPAYLPGTVSGPVANAWRIALPQPNVSGTVTLPNSSEVAPYSDFEVLVWDSNMSEYGFADSRPELYTDENGAFSGFFAPGRYQLTVNPPYGVSNVADRSYEILVDETNKVCLLANSSAGNCATSIEYGQMQLSLAVPNVSGRALKGSASLSGSESASVELRKWDAKVEYWQWKRWSDVSSDGSYSFNIQEVGTYQIVVSPSDVEGYSTGFEYLVVGKNSSGLTFCKIPEPALDTVSRATCGSNTATSGPIQVDVPLQPANLRLEVNVPSQFAGEVYGQIYKIYEVSGWERRNYEGQISLKHSSVSTKFVGFNALDDNNDNPAKYRLDLSSWASFSSAVPLSKEQITIWASDFDPATPGIEICKESDYNKIAETCASGRLLSGVSPLVVELGYGNLSGKAVTPEEPSNSVNFAQLSVEKWSPCFNCSQFYWQWTDNYVQANSQGSFGLNIADPGYYRITTKQQWGGILPFSDGQIVVKVDSSKDWCVLEGPIATSSSLNRPSDAICTLGRDNELSDSVVGLTASLDIPKISGQLNLTSGGPARDASVTLRKWNLTNRYYEHVGWARTNSEGKYYLNPSDDGDYSLNFEPSWQDRSTEIGLDRPICLGANVPSPSNARPSDALSTCSESVTLSDDFVGPNISGIVCTKDNQSCTSGGARYTSIEVRAKGQSVSDNPDNWEWTNKWTSTDSQGKYALRLDPGTDQSPKVYSIAANPNDVSSQGARNRITISVGETICKRGLITRPCDRMDINLLSPNLSGVLTYDTTQDAVDSEQHLMKNSWVSIYGSNYSSYVSGTSTNSQGLFAAFLADGTYFVDSYANSNVASRPTLRLTVKVLNGGVSWKYRSENDSAYSTNPLIADFDYVLPNVKVSLANSFSSSRVILIKDQSGLETEQPRRFVANPSSGQAGPLAKGVLTQGRSYTFKVIPNYGETLSGTCTSGAITINQPEGTSTPVQVDLTSCVSGQ